MGSVWLAEGLDGQLCALKLLAEGGALVDEDSRARLRREAMSMHKIRGAGVADLMDYEVDGPEAFVVTEYIEGLNLAQRVRHNGAMPVVDALSMARELARTLRLVHACGIVHRDIKPSNVMLSANGPVLIDFGIAQGLGDERITHTGLVTGTPGFLAPEVIGGSEPGESSDWWAWAAVVLFALSGRAPFGMGSMEAVLARVCTGSIDIEGVDTYLARVLTRALNPAVANRPSIDETLLALDSYSPWAAETEEALDETTTVLEPYESVTLAVDVSDATDNADSTQTQHMPHLPETTKLPAMPAAVPQYQPSTQVSGGKEPPWLSQGQFEPGSVPMPATWHPTQPPKNLQALPAHTQPRAIPFTGLSLILLFALVAIGHGIAGFVSACAILVLASAVGEGVASFAKGNGQGARAVNPTGDVARAIVLSPWYVLKGLAHAVPAVLVMGLIFGTTLWWTESAHAPDGLWTPMAHGFVNQLNVPGQLGPYLSGSGLSAGALLLGVALLIGQLLAWLNPWSRRIRMGGRTLSRALLPSGFLRAALGIIALLASAAFALLS